MSGLDADGFNHLLATEITWSKDMGFVAEALGGGAARVRLPFDETMLRPGGTISGPMMFALADVAMYAAILGADGAMRMAVTSNLNINFLRRPKPGDLVAEAKMLKLGRRLAVIDVSVYSDGQDDPVAQATGTYALPQE
ncbi:MAG: PaaI family thioesterase [Magnetovibrio sp.]|nr:PaaI family thioesterase [Magnetovibrio sp.]